jgi:hypothetical protein
MNWSQLSIVTGCSNPFGVRKTSFPALSWITNLRLKRSIAVAALGVARIACFKLVIQEWNS